MALFKYQARTQSGEAKTGTIDAPNVELAVSALQRRLLIVISVEPLDADLPWYKKEILALGGGIKLRDVVILSRQLATLFQARIPVVDSLKVLAETTKPRLREVLN